MSKPIDASKQLEASGGDDTLSRTATVNTDTGAFQVEIDGATTDADVHVDARLDDSVGWVTDYFYSATVVGATYEDLDQLDLEGVLEIRVRIVNNDIDNGASAAAILRTV
jgi:hypothetical protein